MRPLPLRVGLSNHGARLAQSEAKLPKQILTLAYSKVNPKALFDPGAECLAVPEIAAQAKILRSPAQSSIHCLQLFFTQAPGASRPFPFQQARQAILLESMNPILNGPGRIAEQLGDLQATHSLSDQQQSVQTMVIARLRRTTDLILEPQDDCSTTGS